MVSIIIQAAAGMRPPLQPVSAKWPEEAHQMLDLMKRCRDQDPKKRPCFLSKYPLFHAEELKREGQETPLALELRTRNKTFLGWGWEADSLSCTDGGGLSKSVHHVPKGDRVSKWEP